ncbi:hypothetical protein ACP70R_043331 [Stipagrostis hirtigluma subsp. patula]
MLVSIDAPAKIVAAARALDRSGMGDQLQLRRPAAIEKIAVPESSTKKACFHVHAGAGQGVLKQYGSSAAVGGSHEAPAVSSPRSAMAGQKHHHPPGSPRTCLCSPTTHAGSFRCRLHRGGLGGGGGGGGSVGAGLHEMGKEN